MSLFFVRLYCSWYLTRMDRSLFSEPVVSLYPYPPCVSVFSQSKYPTPRWVSGKPPSFWSTREVKSPITCATFQRKSQPPTHPFIEFSQLFLLSFLLRCILTISDDAGLQPGHRPVESFDSFFVGSKVTHSTAPCSCGSSDLWSWRRGWWSSQTFTETSKWWSNDAYMMVYHFL